MNRKVLKGYSPNLGGQTIQQDREHYMNQVSSGAGACWFKETSDG